MKVLRFCRCFTSFAALLLCLLLLALSSAPAAPPQRVVFARTSAGRLARAAANEVLVQLRPGVSAGAVVQMHRALRGQVLGTIPEIGLQRVACPPGLSIEQTMALYRRDRRVACTDPNVVHEPVGLSPVWPAALQATPRTTTPNDPRYGELWGMRKILANAAWDTQRGSSSVIVAVVDSGIDRSHEDLSANTWVNTGEVAGNGVDDDGNGKIDDRYGWDFADSDSDPDAEDSQAKANTHGTHCAGTIGARGNNGVGVAGVVWNCKLMAVRVFTSGGTGYQYWTAEGITYAARNGAHVINLSLSGAYTSTEQSAIDYAHGRGVVICAAMANGGDDQIGDEFLANDQTTWRSPVCNDGVLGQDNKVLGVAATDSGDLKAGFSNYSRAYSFCDVSAPGVDVLSSIWPGGYGTLSGTSMATPHVAGLAAMLRSQFPGDSKDALVTRLKNACDNIDGVNPSYAGKLGAGRINAAVAVGSSGVGPVQLSSHRIDDDNSGGSTGNNNGQADPGETIQLPITLRNAGSQTANSVQGVLSTTTAGLTILDSTVGYGNMGAGTSGTGGGTFRVQIGAGVAQGTQAQLRLRITAANGGPWTEDFSVGVGRNTWGEPDDTFQQAVVIAANGVGVNRRLEREGDHDWFAIDCTSGRRYAFATSNLGDLTSASRAPASKDTNLEFADTVMLLYGTDGATELAYDDDGGGNLASLIEWDCPATGRYYVMVRGYSEARTGVYTFTATGAGSSYGEPDDTVQQARLIDTDGTPYDRRLEVEGDHDWFAFDGTVGATYTLATSNLGELSAAGQSAPTTKHLNPRFADTVLLLYDTDGTTELAYNDDSGGTLASAIEWTCPRAGRYFALVRGFSDARTGVYTFTATGTGGGNLGEPDNDYSQAVRVATNGTRVPRFIDPEDDQDWFSFAATAGVSYTFDAFNGDPTPAMAGTGKPPPGSRVEYLDTYLTLFGRNGTAELATNDDGGQGLSSRLLWVCPNTGVYFVQIHSYGWWSTGSYEFYITQGTGNVAPSRPTSCTLTPSAPVQGDLLRARAAGSSDPNADDVRYRYAFATRRSASDTWGSWQAGVRLHTADLPAGAQIKARARATDGQAFGPWRESATVTLAGLIQSRSPAPGATSVARDAVVMVVFGADVEQRPARLAFSLSSPSGAVAGTFRWPKAYRKMVFDPDKLLRAGTRYTARVRGQLERRNGAIIDVDRTWSFTVGSRGMVAVPAVQCTAASVASGVAFTVHVNTSAAVTIEIRNLAGRLVAVLPEGSLEAGTQTLLWTGRCASGVAAPAGSYLATVTARTPDGASARTVVPARRD